jgi:hypothetical protein
MYQSSAAIALFNFLSRLMCVVCRTMEDMALRNSMSASFSEYKHEDVY